jgi:hypothetical protein
MASREIWCRILVCCHRIEGDSPDAAASSASEAALEREGRGIGVTRRVTAISREI